ncbi:hypothetical protein GC087_14645 [Pantoea sp. JZ2]|uniref:hypothetical protein n=1 Tax=Pantoea sp. JZ2 TaxID=2654189 RepID=UPI002B4A4FAE|nr:hypothetical protein [Pantoea sp. JZ2]WRH13763.1 hypothetical protein GC087_14645 [Pantoea sp. JZ2]
MGEKVLYSSQNVLTLASTLAETAATMAKESGITPKDARLALDLASRISVMKKETTDILTQRFADAIVEIKTLHPHNTITENALKKLISAADALLDEL